MNVTSPMPVIDTSRAPFALPIEITLDLPVPPSVNKTRKIDLTSIRKSNEWKQSADAIVMATRRRDEPRRIKGQFELFVTMSNEHSRADLDNGLKAVIDYLRRIEVIEDDSPKFFRKLTVQWGTAPEGCRVTVRPFA